MSLPMRIGVFPGSFNPPTNAHLALIRAARTRLDRVVAVMPRAFPHKQYDGPGLDQRLALLEAARADADFEVAVTERGLYIDIARELRAIWGKSADLWFVCGRDAAQRIVEWDYGQPNAIEGMLDEFGLLVASRQGEYTPPPALSHRVRSLIVDPQYDAVSATEVRSRIADGEPWEHLVPPSTIDLVRQFYGRP